MRLLAAALVLAAFVPFGAGLADPAEAKGFRLRGRILPVVHTAAAAVPVAASLAPEAPSPVPAVAPAPPRPVVARDPIAKAAAAKAAEPWCRSGRTVGLGAGFCEIN